MLVGTGAAVFGERLGHGQARRREGRRVVDQARRAPPGGRRHGRPSGRVRRRSGAANGDRAAEAGQVAGAGLVHAHRDAERRPAARERRAEDRRRAPVQPDALDRHPPAGRGAPLQLDDAAGEGARADDACREPAGRRPAERDGRTDGDDRRSAADRRSSSPGTTSGSSASPGSATSRRRRSAPSRSIWASLRRTVCANSVTGSPGAPDRNEAGEHEAAPVDDPERRRRERHARRRERRRRRRGSFPRRSSATRRKW